MQPSAAIRALAALCITGLAGACTPEPPVIEHVQMRLAPHAFVDVPLPRHGPVAQIGDEARPVVVAPEQVLVTEAFGIVPENGRARVELALPEEVASLPPSAFVLTVQELPFTQPLADDVMAKVARENFALRRDHGWRLERSREGSAVLDLEHDGDEGVQLNLTLSALLPTRRKLVTTPFDLPAAARLELGYGLAGSRTGASTDVEFSAHLACNEAGARELVRDRVHLDGATPASWHDAHVDLDADTGCRLSLEYATDGHAPGAVWSVPRILAPDAGSAADTNVILISLDTLRSDHLSGLGYGRPTSPIIDEELIALGTTFTDTSSTFPQTDVSHLSIFTGLYPDAQPKRGRVGASDRVVMLAELLRDAGLETAAYTEDALVSGAFGFWFGFDQFTERSFAHADRGRPTIEDGIRFLRGHRDRRFFLFLHTYKTHDPYVPGPAYDALWSDEDAWREGGPAPWIPEKHREILDRYDRTIREADDLVGELLVALDELGLEDRTIVVVTSDHGEAFGEHGLTGHGFTPHQEALDVPLVFRGPGIPAGRRIDTPVSIADLTPTLLELLAVAPPEHEQLQGVSLAPAMAGRPLPEDRSLYFSWLRPDAYGVRRGDEKYHRTEKAHEAFDLAKDPFEWQPDRDDRVRAEIDRLLAEHETQSARLRDELGPTAPAPDTAPAIDKRLEQSLEALGYL